MKVINFNETSGMLQNLNTRWDALTLDNHQVVPIFLRVGIRPTILGTRLTGTSRRTTQTPTGTPLLQAGGHIRCPRGSREKFPCCVHQVIGLPVHSRQVLSMFKILAHESHWTGAQIPYSYHMSNPFIKILWFQHKNLVSRVTNIIWLLPVLQHSSYWPSILVKEHWNLGIMHLGFQFNSWNVNAQT
jgi:hypothetical protein